MTRAALAVVVWLVLAGAASAQGPVVIRNSAGTEIGTATTPVRTDPTGSTTQPVSGTVTVTDGAGALNVICDSGCSGGTTDADDASIATGQTTGLSLGLMQAYDGTVWRRVTFGTAGTASAQVWTVQGIASMTPLQVQSNSAFLATETTAAAILTSTNFAAAFGTAGTADSQVLSVQGIASMTPLQVQSNSANLATEATLTGVNTTSNFNAAFGTAGTADSQVMSIQGIASMTPVTVSATNLDVQIGGSDSLTIGTLPSIPAGTNNIGDVDVLSIAAGNNNIGDVDVASIAAGDNDIGNVDLEIAGTGVSTGVGASGAQTQRVAALLHDGVDTAAISAAGALSVDPGTVTVTATNLDVQIGGSDTLTVQGNLTNNNAAPSTNNIGALVARATASAPTYTEGAMVTLSVDNTGAIRTNASGGGAADGTTFTENSTAFSATGGVYYESLSGIQSGKEYAARITAARAVHENLRDSYGQELGTATNPLIVAMAPSQYAARPAGGAPLVPQPSYVVGGPFNAAVGVAGDALKVYPVTPQDPCTGTFKRNIAISQTADARVVQGMSGMRIFLCTIVLIAGAAEIVNFTEGTGTTCGTGTAAVTGSTTDANGESYAANGGRSTTGAGAVALTNTPGNDLCLTQSGSNRIAGNIVVAFAP